jgi:hypothetical protein
MCQYPRKSGKKFWQINHLVDLARAKPAVVPQPLGCGLEHILTRHGRIRVRPGYGQKLPTS